MIDRMHMVVSACAEVSAYPMVLSDESYVLNGAREVT